MNAYFEVYLYTGGDNIYSGTGIYLKQFYESRISCRLFPSQLQADGICYPPHIAVFTDLKGPALLIGTDIDLTHGR